MSTIAFAVLLQVFGYITPEEAETLETRAERVTLIRERMATTNAEIIEYLRATAPVWLYETMLRNFTKVQLEGGRTWPDCCLVEIDGWTPLFITGVPDEIEIPGAEVGEDITIEDFSLEP